MTFSESISVCLRKYIDFDGRASRAEYWWFVLLGLGLSFIPVIGWILRLVILLPSLAVQVRRLHDMNRSAWWLLLLVPPITVIGVFVLLIMSIFPGTPGPNRYGPDPLQWRAGVAGSRPQDNPQSAPPPGADFSSPGFDSEPSFTAQSQEPGQRRYCTQCGQYLQPEARFCTECGTAV